MQQVIQPLKKPFQARIEIPGSKSMTNRALLLAALAKGISELQGVLFSQDTWALLNALKDLGVELEIDEANRSSRVTGCEGNFPNKNASLQCEEAGTVARFLLAACANAEGDYFFDASARLRQRPLKSLVDVLRSQGAHCDADHMPFHLKGANQLNGGEIFIPGDETSQFLSALLMVAPLAKNSVLLTTDHLVSAPYVKMTCDMMAEFGVVVDEIIAGRYAISVPQNYHARTYHIEPDLSTASYFFAAAAITQSEITIPNISRNTSKQADIQFLNVLEKMGCEVTETAAGVAVEGTEILCGIDVNMEAFSDTFMTLAAIAPFANSPTTITGIAHTRLQESDRITAMQDCLTRCNIKTESGPDWLRIFPATPEGAELSTHHDHRIAMSCALLGLRTPNVVIKDAECVQKTCPEFFEMLKSLMD